MARSFRCNRRGVIARALRRWLEKRRVHEMKTRAGRWFCLSCPNRAGTTGKQCYREKLHQVLRHTKMNTPLEIHHVSIAEDAEHYRNLGYCPVECAFGERSIVDDCRMDHHGELAHLEPVSLRAYRDQVGWRSLDPRFVVTGAADADATFGIAALAGLLPHPGFHLEHTSPTQFSLTVSKSWSLVDPDFVRLMELAEKIARADVDPFAERWEDSEAGLLLLAYKQQMRQAPHNAESFHRGVNLWIELLNNPSASLLQSVRAQEQERVHLARLAKIERVSGDVALVECPVWGWDVWYAEIASVIVAYQAQTERCSIGCRTETLARQFFGPRGLLEVAGELHPVGWGGRNTIIGSPRGAGLTRDQARVAALEVSQQIH